MLIQRVRVCKEPCLEELGGVSTDKLRGDLGSILMGEGKSSSFLCGGVDCSNQGIGGSLLASLGANGLHRFEEGAKTAAAHACTHTQFPAMQSCRCYLLWSRGLFPQYLIKRRHASPAMEGHRLVPYTVPRQGCPGTQGSWLDNVSSVNR